MHFIPHANIATQLRILFQGDDLPVTTVGPFTVTACAQALQHTHFAIHDENQDDFALYEQVADSWPQDQEVVAQWSSAQDDQFGGGVVYRCIRFGKPALMVVVGDFGPASPASAPVYIVSAD